MLGIKLMLVGIFLAILAAKANDISIFIFFGIGLVFIIAGLFVKDKPKSKE